MQLQPHELVTSGTPPPVKVTTGHLPEQYLLLDQCSGYYSKIHQDRRSHPLVVVTVDIGCSYGKAITEVED